MSTEWAARQLQQLVVSFEAADKDKSGFLSFDEVLTVITANGFKGSKDEAKKLFAKLDADKDQKLSRDEFDSAIKKLPNVAITEFALRKAFKEVDKDGSGTLSRGELTSAAQHHTGGLLTPDAISSLLVLLSKDTKDQHVDYEEFLTVFGVTQAATVMRGVFTALDTNKSGYLDKDEIIKAVEAEHELKLRAAKISDLLLAWHKSADKRVSYDEFIRVWSMYRT